MRDTMRAIDLVLTERAKEFKDLSRTFGFDSKRGDRVARKPDSDNSATSFDEAINYANKRALQTGRRQLMVSKSTWFGKPASIKWLVLNIGDPLEPPDIRTNAERERDEAIHELTEALRLTVEYLGVSMCPAIPGWSWYDAMVKYAPEKAAAFRAEFERRYPEWVNVGITSDGTISLVR